MIKKSFLTLATLLLVTMFSGCSSDNEITSGLTPDCAITAVTMGTLYRDYQTTLDDGRDTSYVITVPGSAFPMQIDQLKNEVYNTDSLPQGTMVDKIIFSTFTTDGSVLLRKLDGNDTLYSTKDTLDFTTPRKFTVYASDGSGSREYTVKVNVHQADPEAYTWIADGGTNVDIAAMSDMKMLVDNDMLYLWGKKDGTTVLMTRQDAENTQWMYSETTGAENIDLQSITRFNGTFFATCTDGLMKSADGKTWETVTANIVPLNLFGTSDTEIFASTAEGIYGSHDGSTWTACETDAPASLLPQASVVTARQPLITNSKIEIIVAVGYIGTTSVVWKKEIDLTGVETNPWSYYPYTEENTKNLPYLQGLSMIKYENNLYAAGIRDGKVEIYESVDGARTWAVPDVKTILPANIGLPTEIKLATGKENTIWLVCAGTGQMWRGYLNRLKTDNN